MLPQHNNFPCATNRPNMDDEMNKKKKTNVFDVHIALIRYILRSAKRLCGENRIKINTIIKFKQYNNNRWQLCKFVGIINCVCVCVLSMDSHMA